MKTKLIILSSFLISRFSFFASKVNAQINNPVVRDSASQVANPEDYTNAVFQAVIAIFFVVGIIYFLWHLLFAGYHFIGSDGDPKKFEQAKNEIMHASLGLIVMFSIFAILKFVGFILNIQGLENLQIPIPTI